MRCAAVTSLSSLTTYRLILLLLKIAADLDFQIPGLLTCFPATSHCFGGFGPEVFPSPIAISPNVADSPITPDPVTDCQLHSSPGVTAGERHAQCPADACNSSITIARVLMNSAGISRSAQYKECLKRFWRDQQYAPRILAGTGLHSLGYIAMPRVNW